MLEAHNKADAERMLSQLSLQFFDRKEESEQKRFISSLRKSAGYVEEVGEGDSLDKEGLARLRGKI